MVNDATTQNFDDLLAMDPDEVVTHSLVSDITISGGRTLALVTLDNGRDHTRPNTLGTRTMIEYAETLETLKRRAKKGEIHGALGALNDMGVPSFVFINGLALGGGVEIALNANYRTVDSSIPALALPEVFLGIIPGWGGAWLLPNLIGIENALKVIIENPLKNNRTLKGEDVLELGIADAMFGPANFIENSIAWAR